MALHFPVARALRAIVLKSFKLVLAGKGTPLTVEKAREDLRVSAIDKVSHYDS